MGAHKIYTFLNERDRFSLSLYSVAIKAKRSHEKERPGNHITWNGLKFGWWKSNERFDPALSFSFTKFTPSIMREIYYLGFRGN